MFAVALGAEPGHGLTVSAVMADERVGALVMRESDGAISALHRLATGAAEHNRGVPSPVQQDHGLLIALQALAYLLRKLARKDTVFAALLKFGAHVHDFNFWQWTLLHALPQLDQLISAALRVVIGLQRRRCRGQHNGCVGQ